MILFRMPSLVAQSNKIMIWGRESTWSQNGRWDYATIAWHFEKALHETTFDRESTRIRPRTSKSLFAAEILSSIKKSTRSLQKLHSRNIELYCVAKLRGEDGKHYIEGTAPAWVKLLSLSGLSDQASLSAFQPGEWFSFEYQPQTSIYIVRPDIADCPHHFEVPEPGVCRFELLSEWLSAYTPLGIGFDPEVL